MIRTWYLDAVDGAAIPRSMAALRRGYQPRELTEADLPADAKWEPILRAGAQRTPHGWVPLRALARVQRGIATGCNAFFFVSRAEAARLGIAPQHQKPCIGRAKAVTGRVLDRTTFAALEAAGGPTRLLDFTGPLSAAERRYIDHGAAEGLPGRYLLKARRPWYKMEQRDVAPIWAAVFGRAGFRFVLNTAGAHCLTTFHGLYPVQNDPGFHKALCAVLNSHLVRAELEQTGRRFGGGLRKLEPKDLSSTPVPDLRTWSPSQIQAVAEAFGPDGADTMGTERAIETAIARR